MNPRLRVVVRWRSARSRLARFVTGSLAAHGFLVAAILVLPMMRQAPQTFDDAMVVALAGPLPGPAAAPAPAAPPKAPEPKEAHTVREVPKPQPKATPVPKKKEEAPVRSPAPSAPPGPTQEDTPAPPTTGETKGSGAGAAGTGPTGVTAVLGGGDASLGFYGAAVKAALESAWMKPFLEEQGETYSATVSFVILRDGTTRDVKIVSSSGAPSLDRSAMRAVIEASPLPPIPPAWQGDTLPATMRFDLTPEGR
jgi:protein TonB